MMHQKYRKERKPPTTTHELRQSKVNTRANASRKIEIGHFKTLNSLYERREILTVIKYGDENDGSI